VRLADRHPKSSRRLSFLGAVAALAVAGLGFSNIVVTAAGASTVHRVRGVVVSTANDPLGTILVSGKTLYTLKASATPCAAQCLKVWPELLLPKGVKKAKAGAGVSASELRTVKRAHGARQVTYEGKALYFFSGDTASGQVNGNVTDAWGTWSDVVLTADASNPAASNMPAGAVPSPTAGTSPPPTNSGSHTTPPPTTPGSPVTSPPPPPPPPPTTPTRPPPPPPTTTTVPSGGGVSF
jgi:predicted lipoprotein with Yx(FWY)xxD motif